VKLGSRRAGTRGDAALHGAVREESAVERKEKAAH
jgi:hypothetical protein